MRTLYRFDEKERVWKAKEANPVEPSAPYIHNDSMPVAFNHATMKYYDSKSRFLRDTKAADCVVVGNDYVSEKAQKEFEERRRDETKPIDWRKTITEEYDRRNRRE